MRRATVGKGKTSGGADAEVAHYTLGRLFAWGIEMKHDITDGRKPSK